MLVNYTATLGHYIENSQINPLRWVLLHQVDEGVYENTTNVFKCKDYFNDFVATYHKAPTFGVYGMQSDVAKFDEHNGLSVAILNLHTNFEHNFNVVITKLCEAFQCKVTFTPLTHAQVTGISQTQQLCGILYFDSECFKSTFRMSVLTLFIRNCNDSIKYNNYKDFIYHSRVDPEGDILIEDCFTTLNFSVYPEQDFWWYGGPRNNSTSEWVPSYGQCIHDNGQMSWRTYFYNQEDCYVDEEEYEEEEN